VSGLPLDGREDVASDGLDGADGDAVGAPVMATWAVMGAAASSSAPMATAGNRWFFKTHPLTKTVVNGSELYHVNGRVRRGLVKHTH